MHSTLSVTFFLAALVGCGTPRPDPQAPDAGTSVHPADAGADAGNASEVAGHGQVQVSSSEEVALQGSLEKRHLLAAHFRHADEPAPGSVAQGWSCTRVSHGACSTAACAAMDGGTSADAGPGPTPPHVGVIGVRGNGHDLSLSLDSSGRYSSISGTGALFEGGESFTVGAEGGSVPVFERTVTVPGRIRLTAAPPDGGAWVVDRSADLPVTWTPAPGEHVVLTWYTSNQQGFSLPTEQEWVTCRFPVAPGQAVVSSSVLQILRAGPGMLQGSALVLSSFPVAVPGQNAHWQVDVSATHSLVNGQDRGLIVLDVR